MHTRATSNPKFAHEKNTATRAWANQSAGMPLWHNNKQTRTKEREGTSKHSNTLFHKHPWRGMGAQIPAQGSAEAAPIQPEGGKCNEIRRFKIKRTETHSSLLRLERSSCATTACATSSLKDAPERLWGKWLRVDSSRKVKGGARANLKESKLGAPSSASTLPTARSSKSFASKLCIRQ